MLGRQSRLLRQTLHLLVILLILKVVAGVVLTSGDYMPPRFESGFLNGRDSYFWNGYHLAFYTHVISGPCSLLLGLVLLSESFRRRFLSWHRRLGRVQVVCVLAAVLPSGLWMAFHADGGAVAGVGFGTLAIVTVFCVLLGWRSAVDRRLAEHRLWMVRVYVLLCSAVVLRLTSGLATVTQVEGDWIYPMAAWTSWLVPLAFLEILRTGSPQKATSTETG